MKQKQLKAHTTREPDRNPNFLSRFFQKQFLNTDNTIQQKAGKALILFFFLMIGFTILSRIADSFTVPKVTVVTKESTSLQFNFYGEGSIISGASHYISIPEGIRVEQVYEGSGKTIEKGDALFQLSTQEIAKKLNTVKNEEKKLNIQLEEEKLGQTSSADSSSFENAQADYQSALEDYTETKKEYQSVSKKNKSELLKSKTTDYEKQKDAVNLLKLEADSGIADAEYAMNDAKKELNENNAVEDGIIASLKSYQESIGKDNAATAKALEEICLWAYDNDTQRYETHKKEIASATKKVERAQDSLNSIRLQYSENQLTSGLIAYAASVRAAENDLQDAKDNLYSLNNQENKIIAKAYEYVTYCNERNDDKAAEVLVELFKAVYGDNDYKAHMKLTDQKSTAYERLKTAYDNKKQQYQMKEKEGMQILNDLKKDCQSLKDGTYDFEEALKSQKELLKSAEKSVLTAKRALKSAKREYTKQTRNSEDEKRKSELRQESISIDLQEKKEVRIFLEKLKKKKGIIYSDTSGIVNNFTLKAGVITTAGDMVSIGNGSLGVQGTFAKEDGEYLAAGDEFSLQLKGKNEKVHSKIESIIFLTDTAKGEIAEITGNLDNESFNNCAPGASLSLEVTKNSDLYPVCVPISALRADGAGTYLLKIREENGLLGKELRAERVAVQVIEKNKIKAAVQGNVTDDDKIISESNKMIAEGDRVRIKS